MRPARPGLGRPVRPDDPLRGRDGEQTGRPHLGPVVRSEDHLPDGGPPSAGRMQTGKEVMGPAQLTTAAHASPGTTADVILESIRRDGGA